MSLSQHQPAGVLRLGLRLPIWLYRAHLGWLLDSRFMLIEHIGRKSGQTRKTVVEVLRCDRENDVYYVASGWGTKADWYQNIQKTPDVTITVGRRRLAVKPQFLSSEEGARELFRYSQEHPTAFRELTRIFLGKTIPATEQEVGRLAEYMPIVAFHKR